MSNKILYLGIECGGSKTTALSCDENLVLLNQVVVGPANLRLIDDGQLQHHFEYLKKVFPHPSAVGVGMAGIRNEKDVARVRRVVSLIWPNTPFWVGNDLQAAMGAAMLLSPNKKSAKIIVISGTGSCVYGKTSTGKSVRVGGWGHLLGDRGSGYDIALRALRLCIMEHDRTGRWPHLGQRILRVLQMNDPDELIEWIHNASKVSVAALAEEVINAWNQRDALAKRIMIKTADILVSDVVTCVKRMRIASKKPIEVYLNGGIVKNNEKLTQVIKNKLSKTLQNCVVSVLSMDGAWGAVNMAKTSPGAVSNKHDKPNKIPINEVVPSLPQSTDLSPTEMRNANSMNLDQMSTIESVTLMLKEESTVTDALLKVKGEVAKAIGIISESLSLGGKLFYVGSGTSGRLGVLDATECPPTFHIDPDMVQGIIAGGQKALWMSIEDAEDSFENGYNAAIYRGVRENDVIVGIAASGKTPFVWGAIKAGLDIGARTVFLCFNPNLRIPRVIKPHILIVTDLGPEVLTGSTRLKAGTATKLVLNMFTTLSMVRLGKVISNLMIDLKAANEKLRQRAVRIVVTLTGCSEHVASETLIRHDWNIKKCIETLNRKKFAKL